ncbi:hypothetical protein J3458_021804 [Metarhizium acridum]|uniref:uncharacterized protein n=1 Tax=Metarhizium acridum TaxID=92637 RepID=UPI001C6B7021|nr:hypothetical protein J3458_021804 [Metarhizium acridum]
MSMNFQNARIDTPHNLQNTTQLNPPNQVSHTYIAETSSATVTQPPPSINASLAQILGSLARPSSGARPFLEIETIKTHNVHLHHPPLPPRAALHAPRHLHDAPSLLPRRHCQPNHQ